MERCPHCGSYSIGMDTIYADGVKHFCQGCGAGPERIPVNRGISHADIVSLALSAWNEWAETQNPASNQDLRYSA